MSAWRMGGRESLSQAHRSASRAGRASRERLEQGPERKGEREDGGRATVRESTISAGLPWPRTRTPKHRGAGISRRTRPAASLSVRRLRVQGDRLCASGPPTAPAQLLWGPVGIPKASVTTTLLAALRGRGHTLQSPRLPPAFFPAPPLPEERGRQKAQMLRLPPGVPCLQTLLPSDPPNFCCFRKGLKTRILNIGPSPILLPS